jgi:hypothetical protein
MRWRPHKKLLQCTFQIEAAQPDDLIMLMIAASIPPIATGKLTAASKIDLASRALKGLSSGCATEPFARLPLRPCSSVERTPNV